MTTLLVYAPALAHTMRNHPECHERLAGLIPLLDAHGVLPDLVNVRPVPASVGQLQRIHTTALIETVQQTSSLGGGLLDHGDTYATADSYELARLAAGGCCLAVDQIMSGRADNGIALVRPPGHHAERNRVGGFCLFNNVAAAARQAQAVHGVERVLILDFDVHHGNGTQDIFYEDDSVLFISTHLFAPFFYPGIGGLNETGQGKGKGYTLNVPLPPFVGDDGYGRILDKVIRPKVGAFDPDLVLVSAGFDAHWQDPLSASGLTLTGYAHIGRSLVNLASEICDGRILFVLEGGYQQEALNYGILNLVYALLGRDEIKDDLGPMPQNESDVSTLIARLRERHLLD